MNNSNILIIGGAGFVGSNLCLKILSLNPSKIVIVDNLFPQNYLIFQKMIK